MLKTFIDISDEIRELQTQLEEHAEANDGDITTFPLLAHLEELEKAQAGRAAQEHLLCNLACMALEYEGEADAMRAQAKRIQDQAALVEKKADGIRAFLDGKIGPTDKVKDDRVSLSKRKSSAVQLAEGLVVESLPIEYQRITIAADKTALKKGIEAGEVIEGVAVVTRYNLQIK
jgi:Siphovirus Gp157